MKLKNLVWCSILVFCIEILIEELDFIYEYVFKLSFSIIFICIDCLVFGILIISILIFFSKIYHEIETKLHKEVLYDYRFLYISAIIPLVNLVGPVLYFKEIVDTYFAKGEKRTFFKFAIVIYILMTVLESISRTNLLKYVTSNIIFDQFVSLAIYFKYVLILISMQYIYHASLEI